MAETYTVYGLRDPDLDLFRYVGFTQSFDVRQRGHKHSAVQRITDSRRVTNRVFGWIADLRERGYLPDMEPLEAADSRKSGLELERAWIARLFSGGHPLLNREVVGSGSKDFCVLGETMMRIACRHGVCGSSGIQKRLQDVGYRITQGGVSQYLLGDRRPSVEFHSAFALAFQITEQERAEYALAATFGKPYSEAASYSPPNPLQPTTHPHVGKRGAT